MGQSGNATQIVYLCDATGSMISKRQDLYFQIRKAVGKLSPIQFFNVIFFQDGDSIGFSKGGLVAGNAKNKGDLASFLINDVNFRDGSNPLPGLRTAFKQNPQLIYMLTDGAFDSSGVTDQQVLAEIKRLNGNGKVKINTIFFASDESQRSDPGGKLLKQIADENGGNFAFVTQGDLR